MGVEKIALALQRPLDPPLKAEDDKRDPEDDKRDPEDDKMESGDEKMWLENDRLGEAMIRRDGDSLETVKPGVPLALLSFYLCASRLKNFRQFNSLS